MNELISLTKIYIKKIYSSLLIKIILLSFYLIFIFLSIYGDFANSVSLLLFLTPYIFLFLTADMVKEEIERGYFDNRIFLLVPKQKILYSKIISIFGTGMLYLWLGYTIILLIGVFKGERVFFNEKFVLSLLAGIQYIFLGLFLGIFLKGASNALSIVIFQILAFLMLAKAFPTFLISLEKGIFANYLDRIFAFILLNLIPNFILMESLKKFFYILTICSFILFLLTVLLFKKAEFKRG